MDGKVDIHTRPFPPEARCLIACLTWHSLLHIHHNTYSTYRGDALLLGERLNEASFLPSGRYGTLHPQASRILALLHTFPHPNAQTPRRLRLNPS